MKLPRRKRVATAQTPVHKGVGHYGPPIRLDQAKKAMAAAPGRTTGTSSSRSSTAVAMR
jgi:hypothetical protein